MKYDTPAVSALKAIFIILWVAIIIAAYYVVHKPWGAFQLTRPLMAILDLCLALALASLAGGLGHRIMGIAPEVMPLERIAINFAMGVGYLGLGVLALGVAGLIVGWIAWLIMVIGLIWLRNDVLSWLYDWRYLFDESYRSGWIDRLSYWLVMLLVILNLFKALAPPLKWDSLAYHLELPKQYIAAGQVYFLEENLYGGFPQTGEMLYTWGMALRSDTTAAVFGWAVGVVGLVGVAGFACRLAGQRATWLAPAVLLSGSSISQALSWAYVDLWIMLFGLAVLCMLDYYVHTKEWIWLVRTGIIAGFAIGTKYTAGVLLPIGAVVLFPMWDRFPPRIKLTLGTEKSWGNFRRFFLELVVFWGMAGIVALPWLVKNLAFTGSPLYPYEIMGGGSDALGQSFQNRPAPERSLSDDLVLPIDMTIFGIENAQVEGRPEYGTSVGPLMLALIVGLLAGWGVFNPQQRNGLVRLLAVALATWLVWAVAARFARPLLRSRHYFGVFPALAVLAVAGFQSVANLRLPGIRVGRVMASLVALALGFTALTEIIAFVDVDPLPVLMGFQTDDEYVAQELGPYAIAMQAVNNLPTQSKVLFLWEPRPYYCGISCLPDGVLDRWLVLHHTVGDAASIAEFLRQRGITHVLMYNLGAQFLQDAELLLQPSDWEELDRFRNTELNLLDDFYGNYSLYELNNAVKGP